jgi:hypothetical protein
MKSERIFMVTIKGKIVHMLPKCVHQAETVEDMSRSVPRIYVTLENKKVEFQSHMIEVEAGYRS